jgi:GDP-4-dehydro-6-deoxy-D-mannose reductase
MRVLITGATGFVGGWLAAELTQSYPQATFWGTAHGPAAPEALPACVGLLPCDLTDPDATAQVVDRARPDHVFHLAGWAATAAGDAARIRQANVDAAVHLLRALEGARRPCRVLLVSSGYVYGPTRPGRPAQEDDALHPRGAYAESKAAMEAAAQPFAGRGGLSLVVARAFNHTGPRQGPDFVVPAFARQIARIERGLEPPRVRVGNLQTRRDFLDVRDVVRAYRLLGEADDAPWRVVNVASGAGVSIQALLDRLLTLARVPLSVEPDPGRMRPSDLPESVGSPARLRTLTGWQPRVPQDQMLADTLDWWRGQSG